MEVVKRQELVNKGNHQLSISRQCNILGLNRSTLYYTPSQNGKDKPIMDRIDRIMTEFPYYGSRKVTSALQAEGIKISRERVRRLLKKMGLRAVQPRRWKNGSKIKHPIYPYLLENLVVTAPNQVWCTDISYIPTRYGWGYLVALLDLYSRKIVGWRLSNTLEAAPCVEMLKEAIAGYGKPSILNSDRGCQYTSQTWIETATQFGICLSMAGKGRCFDNIHMERFWRTLKQEEVYLTEYVTLKDARIGITSYITQYNARRLHQSLGNRTPDSIYGTGSFWDIRSTPINQEIKKS